MNDMAWFTSFLPFACLMGIGWGKGNRFGAEFEMREGMSYHWTSAAAVLVYQSLLGTAKTCWHTTRSHPLIIRSVRMRISPRHAHTHAHIREEQRLEHPRTVWGGGWWMALSLCHMATHHASTVCLSIVSSASPLHPPMIPTTLFNRWYRQEVRVVQGIVGLRLFHWRQKLLVLFKCCSYTLLHKCFEFAFIFICILSFSFWFKFH